MAGATQALLERLEERARRLRSRAALRAWEYRQRDLAHGVWYKLRRVLADAEQAFAIDESDAQQLIDVGCVVEPVGQALAAPMQIFFVEESLLSRLPSRRRVALHLNAEMLAAQRLALVPFP